MDCFYIITNKLKDKDYAITSQIEQYIQSSGKKCFLSEKDSEGHIIPGTVPKEAECGLVLGGDGTLIRAVRDLGERSLPLLGINLGTLGYLTDVDLEDFESALDHLFSETPVIEERMMLEGSFRNSRKDMAMNDIVIAREVLQKTKLHVIIRPRGGDFLYSPIEQRIMLKDIDNARRLGADGVVLGCLTDDGEIDIPLMKQFMEAAQDISVTFHRAFDVCRNPQKALEDIISLGCDRILTSGQQATAELGIPLLKELQQQAAGRITLLAGCGVNETNIARIAQETGINEFHFSARETVASRMQYRKERVPMGATVQINEFERNVTTKERVKKTIGKLRAGS